MTQQLSVIIDAAWDARDGINSATKGEVRDAVQTALAGLDDGSGEHEQVDGVRALRDLHPDPAEPGLSARGSAGSCSSDGDRARSASHR